jgi:hypothetical protein
MRWGAGVAGLRPKPLAPAPPRHPRPPSPCAGSIATAIASGLARGELEDEVAACLKREPVTKRPRTAPARRANRALGRRLDGFSRTAVGDSGAAAWLRPPASPGSQPSSASSAGGADTICSLKHLWSSLKNSHA